MGCTIHDDHQPFFTPSYLRHSRHVQRLQKAWEEHISELREELQRHPPPQQPPLSTHSSSVNLNKTHVQHLHNPPRPAVQDVIERLPPLPEEDRTHPLPSRWSDGDHMTGLELLAGGSEVRFNGVTKTTDEAALSLIHI